MASFADSPLSRCFSSAVEARLAGYQPATTPAGYLLAGGVYFERAGPAVATQCTKAAQELQTAVPCPTLVPTSWPGSRGLTCPPYGGFGPSPSTCTDGPFVVMSQGLIYTPPDLYLHDSPGGELLMVAHRDAPPSTYKDFYDLCLRPVHRSTSMVGSSVAELLYCPQDVTLHHRDEAGTVWSARAVAYGIQFTTAGASLIAALEVMSLLLEVRSVGSREVGPRRGSDVLDVAIAGDNQRALDVIVAVANHIRFVPPR